jgi:alanyl-tRNA synthetase
MEANSLRDLFRAIMKEKGHVILPSASLVRNDRVLFTTAGVHPLVEHILSGCHPLGDKLASIQLCLRTDDLEEVGDNTHHTSFEMLGNWLLQGAFSQKEAIELAYSFLVEKVGIKPSLLAATVFEGDATVPEDDEAASLWQELGVPTVPLGREHNWWGPVAETGPCGPDTEIFVFRGQGSPPKGSTPANDSSWVEIWNVVSMIYFQNADGTYRRLESPVIDTGMGFERLLAVINGVRSAYETDLFDMSLIRRLAPQDETGLRIIADHVRSAVHLVADGVMPDRKKHGAVLRRLVRRAVFQYITGDTTTGTDPSAALQEIALDTISRYRDAYPRLEGKRDQILSTLADEVANAVNSLERGRKSFEKATRGCTDLVSAQTAFKLQSQDGCPLEETVRLASLAGWSVDVAGFQQLTAEHRMRSR